MQDESYLARLRTYWKRHNAFPPMVKLCDIVGLSSTSSVFAMVGRLVEAGYLERTEGRICRIKQSRRVQHLGIGRLQSGKQPAPQVAVPAEALLRMHDGHVH